MNRSILLVAAGILAAALFACALPTPSPPPSSPLVCAAIANVQMVSANYDPTNGGAPVTTGAAPSNMQADIQTVYTNIAPQFFQTQLCALDGVYITPNAQSWGYRDIASGKHYIALSSSLWSGTAITLDQYEQRVFSQPLNWPSSDAFPPTYLPATPNSGYMTLLAALSHEYGHALWSDIFINPPGSDPQSSRFCNGILTSYMENGKTIPFWNPPLQSTIWVYFEQLDYNAATIPDDNTDPAGPGDPPPKDAKALKLAYWLTQGQIDKAHKILWRILANGRPFPSLLGAFSANEHFVEAFVLYTLLNAQTPLQNLPLQVSPNKISDIPATLASRKRLSRMLQCFDSLTLRR